MQKILLALLGIGFATLMSAGVSAHECGYCWGRNRKKYSTNIFKGRHHHHMPAVNN